MEREARPTPLRLRARLPLVYPVVGLAAAAAGAIAVARERAAPLAIALGAVVLAGVLLGVRVATTRVVVARGPAASIEVGSAFGRRRVPVAEVAVVRRRPLPALVPLRIARWQLIGVDGRRLGGLLDEGLTEREVRALEAELGGLRIPIDRG
ncbi:hypothetical protein OVA14_07795 [Agrococcus sp. SL85]|uniref:hypothetical protein n=1 Tax=Agrococcus sp. SL85 TaxID=2995141 RepID=UPI00226C7226|nr:hypothetical protein [Agrococcus sp. SL85]WAC65287.1 hypothetical protein OVA14_07795 [Agrococcus sp. SL85]